MRAVNRITALLLAAALWGGIFLPGLGSTDLKGEEGRRVMPAVTMLEGGSWLVPNVGGKPFLKKPPLVQWCVAGSLKVFGHNLWAARLPSALSVLVLAMVMILATRGWLIAEQSLLAAIIMMVQVATVEKCRLAELEAVYVALSGIALVLWMSWWAQGRSPWLTWTVPFIFNGLAFLAKAPLHLLFFYAVVVATLARAGELRRLWSLAHLGGLMLMAGVIAAWAVPYFSGVSAGEAGGVWKSQFVERVTAAKPTFAKMVLNLPNGIANHLPWVLFAPLLWRAGVAAGLHPREAALLKGGRVAVALCFVVLLLIPGVLPRYVQPLVTPFSLLLAPAIWEMPERPRRWWRAVALGLTIVLFLGALAGPFVAASAASRGADVVPAGVAGLAVLAVFGGAWALMSSRRLLRETMQLALWTGLIAVMGMLLYACSAVPWVRLRERARPFASRIDAGVTDNAQLIAFGTYDDAPLLATLFHLRTPFRYAADADAAPQGAHLYLVPARRRAEFAERFRMIGEPLASTDMTGATPSDVIWAEKIR
jgi:4-amino-4-deoxy-L-arabinose transferase-like glycosyltransferase